MLSYVLVSSMEGITQTQVTKRFTASNLKP